MELLHSKQNRPKNTYTIPNKIKENLTLRLLDDCFNSDLILSMNNDLFQSSSQQTGSAGVIGKQSNEVSDLLKEISNIDNELELFAMEGRKRKMVELIEKMAEYIDESTIDIDELTDIFFLGKSTQAIENEYLINKEPSIPNKKNDIENTNRMLNEDNKETNN